MSTVKAAGWTKNTRDSKAKYRGVKKFGGQKVVSGNIILKQKWSRYRAWENTYMSRDFSIHANTDGIVVFSKKNIVKFNGRKYLTTIVNVQTEEKLAKKTTKSKVEA